MRLVILLAGVLAASPALPASILYSTAASEQRVDGFCIMGDLSLRPGRVASVPTEGVEPRRLLVVKNGENHVLYVGESDRVEAFKIFPHGQLAFLGATRVCPEGSSQCSPVDVRDLEVSSDFSRLYVVHREYSRVVAYPLDAGVPAAGFKDFTSCIQGSLAAGYHEIEVDRSRSLIYVTADGNDRLDVHQIVGGELPAPALACMREGNTKRDPETPPLSRRIRLDNPKAFVLDTDKSLLYVEERGRRRISAFRLKSDGTFCDNFKTTKVDADGNPVRDADGNVETTEVIDGCELTPETDLCTTWCAASATDPDPMAGWTERCRERNTDRSQTKPEARVLSQKVQHCPISTTGDGVQYQGLILHRGSDGTPALLASQFFRGRIDSFLLRPDGTLTRKATKTTPADLRMSPVGLAAEDGKNVVYIAAGEHDRVVAYALTSNGALKGDGPFSQTDEDKNSFPNAMAIATVDGCP